MKYEPTQRDIGDRALQTAERIAKDNGADYRDVVWLLNRCFAETDQNSSAYKNLRSLITTAKLAYSEELDKTRSEHQHRDKLYRHAQKMTKQSQLKSAARLSRDRHKIAKQHKVWDVYRLIEQFPGRHTPEGLPRLEYRILKDNNYLSHNIFGRLKIRKKYRGFGPQDMPHERRYP